MTTQPPSEPHDRRIRLGNVFNLRDLGGYPAADGRTTRWKHLYRADGLNRLSDSDVDAIAHLGLRTVVDLRTHGELDDWGRAPHDRMGARFLHLPLIDELWPHEEITDDHDPVAYLTARYHEMTDGGAEVLAHLVELIAHTPADLPLVFHCSAGKDRTGVTAAVLLGLAGVPADVIADDYHLTAAAMVDLLEWIRANDPEGEDTMANHPPTWVSAPRGAMVTFLAETDERYGSMERYVRSIGVDDATVDAYRDRVLTEPA